MNSETLMDLAQLTVIDGSGLNEILSKSNMSIIGTENLLTDSHIKTTSYCIKGGSTSKQSQKRLSSDFNLIE